MPERESKRRFFAADAGKVHTLAVAAVARRAKPRAAPKRAAGIIDGVPTREEFRLMQREVQQLGQSDSLMTPSEQSGLEMCSNSQIRCLNDAMLDILAKVSYESLA